MTTMVAIAILADGCAITPSGLSSAATRQLTCTMEVAGHLNPNYFYFVVFNNAGEISGSAGPVPPLTPDWGGNGFVTGSATSYVEVSPATGGTSGYGFGNIEPLAGGNLHALPPATQVINPAPIVFGTTQELQFTIPLSYLATSTVPADKITSIQINFINTSSTPTTTIVTPKLFDALGDTLTTTNAFITIPTQQDPTINNSTIQGTATEPSFQDVVSTLGTGSLTPASDTTAPDLDIINWSVQVSS